MLWLNTCERHLKAAQKEVMLLQVVFMFRHKEKTLVTVGKRSCSGLIYRFFVAVSQQEIQQCLGKEQLLFVVLSSVEK